MFTIILSSFVMMSFIATLIAVAACVRCGQVERGVSAAQTSDIQTQAESNLRLIETPVSV